MVKRTNLGKRRAKDDNKSFKIQTKSRPTTFRNHVVYDPFLLDDPKVLNICLHRQQVVNSRLAVGTNLMAINQLFDEYLSDYLHNGIVLLCIN